MHTPTHHQWLGMAWMFVHCIMITAMSTIVRFLAVDFPIPQLVFFHNVIPLICLLIWRLFRKPEGECFLPHMPRKKAPLYLTRSIPGTIAWILFFYAVTQMPLADVTAVSFTGPLFTTVLAVFILKEKIGIHRIIGLVVGFIGMMIVVKPGMNSFEPASLVIMGAVVIWAFVDISIKVLGRTEPVFNQTFYLTLCVSAFSLPLALSKWHMPELSDLPALIILGLLFLLNIIAVTNAYKYADFSVVMPVDFSRLVMTAIVGYVIFGEHLSLTTILGSLVIISSILYIAHRERRKKAEHA